ncbi:MAG: PAS domain S-box protein [Mycobacteriales bacterium]
MSDPEVLQPGTFERLLTVIDQAVVVTDPAGRILYWNRAAEQMSGWNAAEAMGKYVAQLLPIPKARADASAVVERLAGGQNWSGEFPLRRRDGSVLFGSVSATPVLDDAGRVIYLVGLVSDVSERVAVERRFQAGFESSPAGWAYMDLDGRLSMVNDAFCTILGRSRDELVDHFGYEFVAAEDLSERPPPLADMMAGGPGILDIRRRVVTGSGEQRWIDVTLRLMRDAGGAPEYFFAHVHDITDWIRSQELLTAGKEGYERLFVSVIETLGASHEYVDLFTVGHQRRVERLAVRIAQRLGLADDAVRGVAVGATLHDIGKVGIPARILTKPARLNDAEWALMQRHACDGHDIVAHVEFPWPVPTMILQHHERLDGSGYPGGLSGNAILLESQIIAVADTVDVIASHRPYRPARPVEEALDLLRSPEGRRLFREDVAEAAIAVLTDGSVLFEP